MEGMEAGRARYLREVLHEEGHRVVLLRVMYCVSEALVFFVSLLTGTDCDI